MKQLYLKFIITINFKVKSVHQHFIITFIENNDIRTILVFHHSKYYLYNYQLSMSYFLFLISVVHTHINISSSDILLYDLQQCITH